MKKLSLVLPFFLSFYFNSYSQSYNSTWLSSTYTGSKAFDVKVEGRFAYVVGWEFCGFRFTDSSKLKNLQKIGFYNYDFNSGSLASGIYFYALQTEKFSKLHKMILLK